MDLAQNNEKIQYYRDKWDALSGSNFNKTLELLQSYSGFHPVWNSSGQAYNPFVTYGAAIANIVLRYRQNWEQNPHANENNFFQSLCEELNKIITNPRGQNDSDLQAIYQVISSEGNTSALSSFRMLGKDTIPFVLLTEKEKTDEPSWLPAWLLPSSSSDHNTNNNNQANDTGSHLFEYLPGLQLAASVHNHNFAYQQLLFQGTDKLTITPSDGTYLFVCLFPTGNASTYVKRIQEAISTFPKNSSLVFIVKPGQADQLGITHQMLSQHITNPVVARNNQTSITTTTTTTTSTVAEEPSFSILPLLHLHVIECSGGPFSNVSACFREALRFHVRVTKRFQHYERIWNVCRGQGQAECAQQLLKVYAEYSDAATMNYSRYHDASGSIINHRSFITPMIQYSTFTDEALKNPSTGTLFSLYNRLFFPDPTKPTVTNDGKSELYAAFKVIQYKVYQDMFALLIPNARELGRF